jgi:hypothetical protein
MATPVKTLLMEKIETALKDIQEVMQWKHGQGIPTDQDTAVYPWGCFFDEIETKNQRNRIAVKSFDLVIQVWVKEGGMTIDDQMDLIDAEIEKKILSNAGILDYTVKIEVQTSDKFTTDEDSGILQAVYRISYAHAWRDPYDPAREI